MANAASAGTVMIGDIEIHRLGFGAMRLTGPGIVGPPPNMAAAVETLRSLEGLGVNFVDTSNAYGPMMSELLIRQVLHPYRGMTIATKGGLLRPGPNQWANDGRPEALRAAVELSMKTLAVERIDLWQLHRVDPKVPAGEQFAAIAELQREGKIRHAGLSEVSVALIEEARTYFPVASVQNGYHLIERKNDPVLEHCEKIGIPFIGFFPLATGALASPESILSRIASDLGITPAQAAIAWLLKRSPSMVVIPGTANPAHVRENMAAGEIMLTDEQFAQVARVGQKAALLRAPKS
jgi:aryl-alcohol dehydrogenase-like predicted oxidoreductase